MAAQAAYSDLMKNISSLHLHEGFMAVVVYSERVQAERGQGSQRDGPQKRMWTKHLALACDNLDRHQLTAGALN